jgi:hypothetical protein
MNMVLRRGAPLPAARIFDMFIISRFRQQSTAFAQVRREIQRSEKGNFILYATCWGFHFISVPIPG